MFSASVDYLKVALWKQNAPIENLGLQTPLVCFADSWKVMRLLFPPPFTPGMHPLQIKSFYFGKMGNFVVRTIHIEMSFQCLVKHFHFLICSSTSFQVGICSFLFQSTAKGTASSKGPSTTGELWSLSNLSGAICNHSQGCYSAIDGRGRISSPALKFRFL